MILMTSCGEKLMILRVNFTWSKTSYKQNAHVSKSTKESLRILMTSSPSIITQSCVLNPFHIAAMLQQQTTFWMRHQPSYGDQSDDKMATRHQVCCRESVARLFRTFVSLTRLMPAKHPRCPFLWFWIVLKLRVSIKRRQKAVEVTLDSSL